MTTTAPKPITFVDFLETVLAVDLTDGQWSMLMVAIDGHDPEGLDPAYATIARRVFGCARVPDAARSVLAIVAGARSGKTYLGALYLLWRALTADLATLAPGEVATALAVAPDLRLARRLVRYARGAAQGAPAIDRLIDRDDSDGFELLRGDGRRVRVEALPATRGGSAVRGRSLVGAVLDEVAFFRDSDSVVNDEDVYNAVAPRVVPGGHVILASTPWAESGLLHALWRDEHGSPRTAVVAHAPTLAMRDDEHTRKQVEREFARDPDNARREFGAEFITADASAWFDAVSIARAEAEDRPRIIIPSESSIVAVGFDLAFRGDASALVVVHGEGQRLRVAETIELRPSKGAALVPEQVVTTFADACRRHGATAMVGDLVYIESAREHAAKTGIRVVTGPVGNRAKLQTYSQTRGFLAAGRLEISAEEKRLLAQLREVQARATPGGGVTISSPRRRGSHGDLVSALVLAVWYAEALRAFRDDGGGGGGVTVISATRGIERLGDDLPPDDDDDDEEPAPDSFLSLFEAGADDGTKPRTAPVERPPEPERQPRRVSSGLHRHRSTMRAGDFFGSGGSGGGGEGGEGE